MLGFDHKKMLDAMFRIKIFLYHFSFKYISKKLALWQLQGFLDYLYFVYLAFNYPTTIICTIYFGTSQLQCIPQYIISKLFRNLLKKRESTRKQCKINSFFSTV